MTNLRSQRRKIRRLVSARGNQRIGRSRPSRYGVALLCLAGAWLAHFAWNSPVLSGGFGLGTAGQIAAVLVKGIPALLVVLALVRAAGDREADYYARMLTDAGDPRLATAAEIEALCSPAKRSAARREAYARAVVAALIAFGLSLVLRVLLR